MSEYPNASKTYGPIMRALRTTATIGRLTYGTSALVGPSVIDTDNKLTAMKRTEAVLYFPGTDPSGLHEIATIFEPGPNPHEMRDIQAIREITLGLTLGATALANIPPSRLFVRKQFDQQMQRTVGLDGHTVTNLMCASDNLPIAVVQYARITQSADLPEGGRIAYMHYPVQVDPAKALTDLQNSVRYLIESEKIT